MFGLALFGAWAAEPGTEFVIILDNSCSMVEPHTENGFPRPAADPDRRAVLGALIVEGLTAGTDDRTTVLAFPPRSRNGVEEITDGPSIRELRPSRGTFFVGPLTRARQLLGSSDKRDRMLLVLSDGVPNDVRDPEQGRSLLGVDTLDAETLILGLFTDPQPDAERFLRALARVPADYHRVEDGAQLASLFTEGYARALGSRALTGTLQPGETRSFQVGRYLTEVLVVTATVGRTGPYRATLLEEDHTIPVKTRGDNGCSFRPSLCGPPRMHFQVWRAPHDPDTLTTWTLRVDEAGGPVGYGVLLRYDLVAELESTTVQTGTPSPVRARLTWRGEPFEDADFFTKDDFRAEAIVEGQTVTLRHVGQGRFEGSFIPGREGVLPAEVRFTNTWMRKTDRGTLRASAPEPLQFSGPDLLDFGRWRGGRWATTSCLPLQIHTNHALPVDAVRFDFEGLPEGASLHLDPSGDVLGYTLCVRAEGCCSDLVSSAATALVVRAPEAGDARLRIPVRFQVDRTGFWRCWGPWICAALTLLLLLAFLYGWIRPHDFDDDLTVRVAGSERQLSRSAALVLREQPKGRRGFYRNARVAFSRGGDFLASPRNAAFWVEATGPGETRIHLHGPLEIKDRRTRKWRPVTAEEARDGVRLNVVYRMGDVYYRFQ